MVEKKKEILKQNTSTFKIVLQYSTTYTDKCLKGRLAM